MMLKQAKLLMSISPQSSSTSSHWLAGLILCVPMDVSLMEPQDDVLGRQQPVESSCHYLFTFEKADIQRWYFMYKYLRAVVPDYWVLRS
jgi:hypothetical protein